MAKGIYVGVGGAARKVKSVHVGAGGVKKVKKAFVGVNGKPRLAYSAGVSLAGSYNLVEKTHLSGCEIIGNYLIQVGGRMGSKITWVHNINTFAYTEQPDLRNSTLGVKAARTTNRAIFVGGSPESGIGVAPPPNIKLMYNRSLVRTVLNDAESEGRRGHHSFSIGGKAVFAGGTRSSNSVPVNSVDLYSDNGQHTTTYMETASSYGSGGSTGTFAILGGGGRTLDNVYGGFSSYSARFKMDQNHTITNLGTHTMTNTAGDAVAVTPNHVIFSEGDYNDNMYAIDSNGTMMTPPNLTLPSNYNVGGSLGEFAIFAGGSWYDRSEVGDDQFIMRNSVIGYDDNLVRHDDIDTLSIGRRGMSSVSHNDKVYFLDGETHPRYSNTWSDVVDVYEI